MTFLRYNTMNDRSGQLEDLVFYGPFVDEEEAWRSIPASFVYYEPWSGPSSYVNDADEPLEFFTIVDSLPVKPKNEVPNQE